MTGALNRAAHRCAVVAGADLTTDDRRARDAIREAIREAGYLRHVSAPCIIGFNDAWGRSYDEIREVLEKARGVLQEQGN